MQVIRAAYTFRPYARLTHAARSSADHTSAIHNQVTDKGDAYPYPGIIVTRDKGELKENGFADNDCAEKICSRI